MCSEIWGLFDPLVYFTRNQLDCTCQLLGILNSLNAELVQADCFQLWRILVDLSGPRSFSFDQCEEWNTTDAEIVLIDCVPCDSVTPPNTLNVKITCTKFPTITR